MHCYYYQAMAWDLLEIKEGTYKYESQNKKGVSLTKTVKLTDSDKLWKDLKYT